MAQGVWIHRVRATDAAEDEVVRRVREAMLAETRGEAVDELRAWCRDGLAGYKVPRAVVVVDEIRRSPAGSGACPV